MCLRFRDFTTKARVMDPAFRILPLGEEGGDSVAKADEGPNTKEGIDKYYAHWSHMNNADSKMKIITALSTTQLKNQTGTFLSYLKRKGVHINYVQLGNREGISITNLYR
jgi:hypothetical protein